MQKVYEELKSLKQYPTPASIADLGNGKYALTVIGTKDQLSDLRHPMQEWRARRADSYRAMYASIQEAIRQAFGQD